MNMSDESLNAYIIIAPIIAKLPRDEALALLKSLGVLVAKHNRPAPAPSVDQEKK